jgi:hypothetical protein
LAPSDPRPSIVEQPRDVTVAVGEPAVFEIVVSGAKDNPVGVQWQRFATDSVGRSGWVDLAGKTGFRFVLESPTPNDNGARFRAVVFDSFDLSQGGYESRAALLTVISNVIAPPNSTTITFREDDFVLGGDWTLSSRFTGQGGSVNALSSVTGGNPGSFGRIILTVNSVTPPAVGSVYALFLKTSATYDPRALGAITAIDYAQDTMLMSGGGSGQATALVVQQGGDVYYAALETTQDSRWSRKFRQGLRTADFRYLAPDLSTNPNRSPDFSARGAPLVFGFLRANSTGPNGNGYSTEVGMDNWVVAIYR